MELYVVVVRGVFLSNLLVGSLQPSAIKPNVPMLESALHCKKNQGTYKAECDVAIKKKP